MDKVAVGDVGGSVGAEDVRDVDGEFREVGAAGEEAGDRHDDVVDERGDDRSESATDGDTDCELDDVAAVDKFAKFFEEIAPRKFFERVFVVGI